MQENFRRAGLLAPSDAAGMLPVVRGAEAVIAGSCSTATLAQVAAMRARRPVFDIDPLALAAGADAVGAALDFAARALAGGPILISASAPPGEGRRGQE